MLPTFYWPADWIQSIIIIGSSPKRVGNLGPFFHLEVYYKRIF